MLETARCYKRTFADGGFNGSGSTPIIQNNFDIKHLAQKLDEVQKSIKDQQIIFTTKKVEQKSKKRAQIRINSNA